MASPTPKGSVVSKPNLKQTPLTSWHAAHGGRMVEFAGYEMPVQYEGVLKEHAIVRQGVGRRPVPGSAA